MFTHANVLPHQSFASQACNDDMFSVTSPLFSRLSMLSKRPSWLLFTAGATLPTTPELDAFGIDARKVVKIKASNSMSEKDIIIKALNAKNASAIVASDHFSHQDKQELIALAQQNSCELFFMSASIQQTLTRRHLH